jgi:SAM-dependent methyltransferase
MTQRWQWSEAESTPDASERRRRTPEAGEHAREEAPPVSAPRPRLIPEVSLADFRLYFPHTPTALAIKECARLSAVRRYSCPGPVLDVGCGDGLFARIAFDSVEAWGIDIDAAEGRWAASSQAYSQVITRARLPERFFATCIANCSLEHVPRIDLAMRTIYRSLRPGGSVYLFVPTPDWARQLTSVRLLAALGFEAAATELQNSVDRFFKHHQLHDEVGWRGIVEDAGLDCVTVEPVLSTATTVAFEAFLLPSLAGLLNKHLTTRWTNFPRVRGLFAPVVHRLVQAVMTAADSSPTAEFLVVARRPLGA